MTVQLSLHIQHDWFQDPPKIPKSGEVHVPSYIQKDGVHSALCVCGFSHPQIQPTESDLWLSESTNVEPLDAEGQL